MVSASVQKPGEAVALLPVQNLESSQGNCALLKGVSVFSVKCVQNINGWEHQNGVVCVGLGGAFCHLKPLCAGGDGLCGVAFLAVLCAAVFGCCLPQSQVI